MCEWGPPEVDADIRAEVDGPGAVDALILSPRAEKWLSVSLILALLAWIYVIAALGARP